MSEVTDRMVGAVQYHLMNKAGYLTLTDKAVREILEVAFKEQRHPLTEVEIVGKTCECVDDGTFNLACAVDLARAIERAHGIGGEE